MIETGLDRRRRIQCSFDGAPAPTWQRRLCRRHAPVPQPAAGCTRAEKSFPEGLVRRRLWSRGALLGSFVRYPSLPHAEELVIDGECATTRPPQGGARPHGRRTFVRPQTPAERSSGRRADLAISC
jgi:hypothetical protein